MYPVHLSFRHLKGHWNESQLLQRRKGMGWDGSNGRFDLREVDLLLLMVNVIRFSTHFE